MECSIYGYRPLFEQSGGRPPETKERIPLFPMTLFSRYGMAQALLIRLSTGAGTGCSVPFGNREQGEAVCFFGTWSFSEPVRWAMPLRCGSRAADMPSPSPTSTGTLWSGRNGPSADLRARSPSSWEENRRKASWPGCGLRRTDSGRRPGRISSLRSFRNGWTSSAVFTRNWPASCPLRP